MMMKRSLLQALLCISIVCGCKSAAPTTGPSTQPNSKSSEDVQAGGPAAIKSYNDEKYRIVNKSDEIVAVLENGATVIAKHVDSPVVAMRAYTYTGGVFEGKWLGGGLSHL